jgi:hypothetical protein
MMPQTDPDLNSATDGIGPAESPLFSTPTARERLFIGVIAEPDPARVVNDGWPPFRTCP